MKIIFFICAVLLFIATANLPIGFYTLLRIAVSIGAVVVIVKEFENGISLWVIVFGLITILFNPIIPVFFNEKSVWLPIDIITGLLFLIKLFTIKQQKT